MENFRNGGGFGGSRGGSGGGFRPRNNFSNGPREMHKATCSACSKDCEVPFRPKEGRPVFCKDCYQKQKAAQPAY